MPSNNVRQHFLKSLHTSLKATLSGIQKHLYHQWAEFSLWGDWISHILIFDWWVLSWVWGWISGAGYMSLHQLSWNSYIFPTEWVVRNVAMACLAPVWQGICQGLCSCLHTPLCVKTAVSILRDSWMDPSIRCMWFPGLGTGFRICLPESSIFNCFWSDSEVKAVFMLAKSIF